MLVEFDEPRPWTRFRFGTAPCRSVTCCAPVRSSVSPLKAVRASGVFCADSSVRRAVTMMSSTLEVCSASWARASCA
ncbi:hypothetical protein D3C80_927720 [compost metagenome]